ncbi:YqgE/AlgH family protein [Colwellia sp. D2M02]|uniref:YqgE/AlgH family protein n=1 Tax=Colwellia sp. D2M02 TaxID=2841562 RepID=UPI001C0880E4|nr:YqgE/AlgH family protein [Colwellia sp. D2M02]MBU2892703.1 YqgE/AlgH family protein [Colwellia sp. D2M02]
MTSFQNQFLIAMPSLDDGYFNKTVTYVCEHNEEGAMGLIINLPVNITLGDLLKQIDDEDEKHPVRELSDSTEPNETLLADNDESPEFSPSEVLADTTNSLEQLVLSGGPVGQQRGFVLHSTQPGWSSSLALNKELMITTSKDILLALGTNKAPEKFMVTLGYASWGPGQLEEEIQNNSWLTAPADNDIIFNTPIEQRWKKATNKLGIDLAHLSNDVGHA